MEKYYYNQKGNSFFIAENFKPSKLSKDWKEITKEQFEEMINQEEETPEE